MERHLRNLLYCQTFDSDAKDHFWSSGFCKSILEERGEVVLMDSVYTVTIAHGPLASHTNAMFTY